MKPEYPKIIKSIQKLANKCPHEVSCLDTGHCGEKDLCKVVSSSGENLLWLEDKLPFHCPYLVHFGYGHLCTCPVHSKLYMGKMQKTSSIAGKIEPKDTKKNSGSNMDLSDSSGVTPIK